MFHCILRREVFTSILSASVLGAKQIKLTKGKITKEKVVRIHTVPSVYLCVCVCIHVCVYACMCGYTCEDVLVKVQRQPVGIVVCLFCFVFSFQIGRLGGRHFYPLKHVADPPKPFMTVIDFFSTQ